MVSNEVKSAPSAKILSPIRTSPNMKVISMNIASTKASAITARIG